LVSGLFLLTLESEQEQNNHLNVLQHHKFQLQNAARRNIMLNNQSKKDGFEHVGKLVGGLEHFLFFHILGIS
jgi:hypothetical protein